MPRIAVMAGLLIAPAGAKAATATATLAITATVLSVCTITATPLVFGNYTTTQLDASASVAVLCTPGTAYDIGLGAGSGTGATVIARKLTNAGTTLVYSLYRDAARSITWGETVGTDTLSGSGNGLLQTITVYGRVGANQYVSPGVYTDLIVATITY